MNIKFIKEEGYTPSGKIGIFDKRQLYALAICTVASVFLFAFMANAGAAVNGYIFKILAGLNLFFLVSRQFIRKISGDYNCQTILPLHYCSLNVFILFIAALTSSDILLNYGFAASPLPALSALMFPEADAARFPKFNLRSIEYYTSHTLLVILPVISVAYTGFVPRISSYLPCVLIFAALWFFVVLVNKKLKSNYMYICFGPDHTPLKTAEEKFGKIGYRIMLFTFFSVLFFAMNGAYLLIVSL
jgi:uncharacterized membrane protein YwaF